jgi:hypothetical protein
MIGKFLMSWLSPRRAKDDSARLEAVLAESGAAIEHAEEASREVIASATAAQAKIEATRRDIRRRCENRVERQRHRSGPDPQLSAAIDALKLLERRQ